MGLTPFGVQAALLGIPRARPDEGPAAAPERLDSEAAEIVRDEFREFAHLGGFTLRSYSTPWYGALLRTAADAHQARELAGTLDSETLPMFAHQVEAARIEGGLRRRQDYAEQAVLMRLYAAVAQTLRTFDPAVYGSSPQSLATATGDGGGLGLLERRRLRAQARSLWTSQEKPSWEDLHAALEAAASQLAEWQGLRPDEPGPSPVGPPRLPSGYGALAHLYAEAERQLAALRAFVPALPTAEAAGVKGSAPARSVDAMVRALAADQDTPWKLPRLYELALRFDRMGMRPLLDELARKEADGDLAAAAFDHAWYSSILDQIRVRDPRYAADRGGASCATTASSTSWSSRTGGRVRRRRSRPRWTRWWRWSSSTPAPGPRNPSA